MAISMINAIDGYYQSQSNTRVMLYSLQALSDNGPMVSLYSNHLLGEFTNWLKDNPIPFRAAAHLFSGKKFSGGAVGTAYLSTLCNPSYGHGVNQATLGTASAGIIAHELGHNYGAGHDNQSNSCQAYGFIMQIYASSKPPSTFSTCSLAEFAQFRTRPQAACLAQPPYFIFSDEFEKK